VVNGEWCKTEDVEQLESELEFLKEDKKSFIEECNNLRKEKLKLKKERDELLEENKRLKSANLFVEKILEENNVLQKT